MIKIQFIFDGHIKMGKLKTLDDLILHLKNNILPYCPSATEIGNFDFQHLDYTRCSVKSIGSKSINAILRDTYSSAFYLPIKQIEIEGIKHNGKTLSEWFPGLFVVHNSRYYFSVLNRQKFLEAIERNPFGTNKLIKQTAIDFFNNHLSKENDVERIVIEKDQSLKAIFDCWNKGCSNLVLSSVGIAIAIIYVNIKTNANLNMDFWLGP